VGWLGAVEADMDNVNNRSLFRNRSGAAREKVRQMGRVREPQGILSAFPELMQGRSAAAAYDAAAATYDAAAATYDAAANANDAATYDAAAANANAYDAAACWISRWRAGGA
jgi:hypothetical protein